MTFNEYQRLARRTQNENLDQEQREDHALHGKECPHLMEIVSPEPISPVQETPFAAPVEADPEPKKRTTKRSTAKKAD